VLIAGRFRVELEVGAGASGVVYRARDVESGEPVALKLFHGAATAAEATLLARLSHPALPRLVAHGVIPGGRRWLAAEWIEGETLAERLERGPLGEAAALALARRLAGALAEIHRLGGAHGDVKPANVVLERGAPAAARLVDAGAGGQGSEGFRAPEGAGGARGDVFALGRVVEACGGPAAVVAVLCDPDPARRPEDGEAARRALEAGPDDAPFAAEERVVAVVVTRDGARVIAGRDAARRARALAGPSSSVALGTGRSQGGRLVTGAALIEAARARLVEGEVVLDEAIHRLTGPRRHDRPLVGRDRELAILLDSVAVSRSALILGRPGVGKSRLLEEVARRTAPAAIVDDLELAPAEVVEAAERAPYAVAAARPEGRGRFPGRVVSELRLAPLPRRAAAAFGVSGELFERAGGNPFLVEELARAGDTLPLTVRALVEEGLEVLGADERRTLRAASASDRIDATRVAALLGEPAAAVAERLDGLARREVLEPEAGGWRFASALLREVVRATVAR
jgi:hypothetical protein